MSGSERPDRISPESLLALVDRIHLSELIGRTVLLKKEGREWVGSCPFHQEKTPSLKVNDANGRWCCFGCSAKEDAIDFHRKLSGLSFKDAVNELAFGHGLSSIVAASTPPYFRYVKAAEMAATRWCEEWREVRIVKPRDLKD